MYLWTDIKMEALLTNIKINWDTLENKFAIFSRKSVSIDDSKAMQFRFFVAIINTNKSSLTNYLLEYF